MIACRWNADDGSEGTAEAFVAIEAAVQGNRENRIVTVYESGHCTGHSPLPEVLPERQTHGCAKEPVEVAGRDVRLCEFDHRVEECWIIHSGETVGKCGKALSEEVFPAEPDSFQDLLDGTGE